MITGWSAHIFLAHFVLAALTSAGGFVKALSESERALREPFFGAECCAS
jgi:hypothetical protein